MMNALWILLVVFGAMAILEILVDKKRKESNKTNKIIFRDEGEAEVRKALALLNEARLTAKANKPK